MADGDAVAEMISLGTTTARTMKQQTLAYLYASITVLLWSTVASAFKLSLRHLGPQELLLFATLVSVGVLGVFVIVGQRYRDFLSWTAGDFFWSSVLGFLVPFLYYRVLFEAYALLPAQEAQPLNFAWPLVLALLSTIVLKQPISFFSLGAMCISFVGVLLIATRGDVLGFHITNSRGVLLALGSTVIWASYWIYGLKDQRDPIARLFANFAFGSMFVSGYTLLSVPVRVPPIEGLLGAIYVGTFEMGVTFVTWLMALRLSRTTAQVGNLIFLTPFISLFFIRYAVGEMILPSTLAGLTLIVVGIILQQRYGDR